MKDFDIINSNLMDNDLLNVNRSSRNYYSASGESEGDAEGDAEYENEDYTEYESEESEIGDTSGTDLPKFRTLVRNKKLEYKAQYGKAHIVTSTVRKCATVQVPKVRMVDKETCVDVPYTNWDANINCSSVCVRWNIKLQCQEHKNKCLGGFVGGTRRECKTVQVPQAYTEAEEVCVNVPHFKWVSGWRKQWREFKRNGGLAQLKLQSKGLAPAPVFNPINTPVSTHIYTPVSEGIIDVNPREFGSPLPPDKENGNSGSNNVYKKSSISKNDDKILGMPKDTAISIGVAVLVLGTFAIIRKAIA